MKSRKILGVITALSLTAVIGLGATLAYLTNITGTLTNKFVFTDQNIQITLDEVELDANNEITNKRITAGGSQNYNNLLPNMIIDKDPTVTVTEGNVNCHVFVSVKNANSEETLKITDLNKDAWEEIDPEDYGKTAVADTKYYIYMGTKATGTVEKDDTFKVIPSLKVDTALEDIFEHVQVGNVAGKIEFTDIVIKAAAVQADSCTDKAAADTGLGMLIS